MTYSVNKTILFYNYREVCAITYTFLQMYFLKLNPKQSSSSSSKIKMTLVTYVILKAQARHNLLICLCGAPLWCHEFSLNDHVNQTTWTEYLLLQTRISQRTCTLRSRKRRLHKNTRFSDFLFTILAISANTPEPVNQTNLPNVLNV